MDGEAKKRRACQRLDDAGVAYEKVEHEAVYTIEAMDALELPHAETVVKNLFLRDPKGKRHFLVVLPGHKQADLKALGQEVGVKLSFASEERLEKYLDLTPGSVTPLGVLNDDSRSVEVFFDARLREQELMGVHPDLNTATVFLKTADLVRLIREHGNPFQWVELP